MARSNTGANILALCMLLAGGGSLFACVYLPPWLELRALRAVHAAEHRRVVALEEHVIRLAKQIEHIRTDPAYMERLARREFGLETPGVEVIPVEVRQDPTADGAERTEAPPADEFADELEHAVQTNPFIAVFVTDATRPVVMGMSGVVVLFGVFLLTRVHARIG